MEWQHTFFMNYNQLLLRFIEGILRGLNVKLSKLVLSPYKSALKPKPNKFILTKGLGLP